MEIGPAFAKVLKRLRVTRGLSQERLGAKCGLHRTHISMIEREERIPSLDTVYKLSQRLDVPLPQLMQIVLDEMEIQTDQPGSEEQEKSGS